MTTFAKRTMHRSEWVAVKDRIGALQIALRSPHDLMMFKAKGVPPTDDDIYIGLPDGVLLSTFYGFIKVSRESLPDYLAAVVVWEDGFKERFPDIAKKRRSQLS